MRDCVEFHDAMIDLIKQRKLKLFRHVRRMKDQQLVKTVMLGMKHGNRPCRRPARGWIDDITDWCNYYTLPAAVRLVRNRYECQRLTGLNGPHGSRVQRRKKTGVA